MHKRAFVRMLERSGMKDAQESLDKILEGLVRVIESGESVVLLNFGRFYLQDTPEQHRRNPQNGAEVVVPPHQAVRFAASPTLKNRVNRKV